MQRNYIDLITKNHLFDHIFSALHNRTSNILFLFEFSALAEFFIAKPNTKKEHKRSLRVKTEICRSHRRSEKSSYREHSIEAHGFSFFHSRVYSNRYYIGSELKAFNRGSWFFAFPFGGLFQIIEIGGLQVR